MILSMTAFGRNESQQPWGQVTWEIRSVNHRYLEPGFRLPDNYRGLEFPLREKLRKTLSRGKVDSSLRIEFSGEESGQIQFQPDKAQELVAAIESIANMMKKPGKVTPLDILQWPGIRIENRLDEEVIKTAILDGFSKALEQLRETRQREGEELKKIIQQRLDSIEQIVIELKQQLPQILSQQEQKLRNKLDEVCADRPIDDNRLEQEIAYLAQKSDVDEELDRLNTHVEEVRRILNKGGACGRRLDFMMQELNREANTLSSKAVVTDTTQAAVELKVLIEQMREQIQNIE